MTSEAAATNGLRRVKATTTELLLVDLSPRSTLSASYSLSNGDKKKTLQNDPVFADLLYF